MSCESVEEFGTDSLVDLSAVDGGDDSGDPIAITQNYTTFPQWQSGNAAFECLQAGACEGGFSWKIDENAPNGMYYTNTNMYGNVPTDFESVITISNSDGYTFDWSISSGYAVCAVIVKGGQGANVYSYELATSGQGLFAPVNSNNGKNFEISHVSFCFKKVEDMCYKGETAWATGSRYVSRGNWATYTSYSGAEKTVSIYAGQTMQAGTATFSAPNGGFVDITIELANGFVFYYDVLNATADNNIKIQDYAVAPKGNPSPGLFRTKAAASAGSTSYTITVPANNFYGVHLDVAYQVPCE
jgi:hypothetical protein